MNWKPLLLIVTLFLLREFGGQAIIFSYTFYIFQSTGVPFDEFTCTIFVGAIRLIFTVIGAVLIDRVGRRSLYISCLFIYFLAMIVAGLGFWVIQDRVIYNWVVLVCVLLSVLAYGVGVGPVPWILLGELLPLPVRPLCTGISVTLFEISSFSVLFVFPTIQSYGMEICFIIFAVSTLITIIIAWKYLPETRGKTLVDLEQVFSSNSKNDSESTTLPPVISKEQMTEKGIDNKVFYSNEDESVSISKF